MALRNKETGETYCNGIPPKPFCVVIGNGMECYSSLAEVNEKWEDYEEPKQSALRVMILTLANFIENEPSDNVDLEDCKDMLKKLEAWERLKDEGIIFKGKEFGYNGECYIRYEFTSGKIHDFCIINKDLDLLFGGEDE